jgi:hypothetical protein
MPEPRSRLNRRPRGLGKTPHELKFGLVISAVAMFGLAAIEASAAPAVQTRQIPLNVSVADRIALQEINVIRHRFGLASARASRVYQSLVSSAARSEHDPSPPFRPGTVEWFGVWGVVPASNGLLAQDVRAVIDGWVYHDGWNGSRTLNLDCTSPTAPGCNSHRRAILSAPPQADTNLYVDVAVVRTNLRGFVGVSIAATLVWRTWNSTRL